MEYFKKTLKQIHQDLREKKISVKELVLTSLDRIKATDDQFKSFITVRDLKSLEKDIVSAQKRVDSGDPTIITGIPYSAKDLFCTKGIRTTASSKVLDQYIPQYTATVIKLLDAAGAILVGKTNLDAFAHGSSTESSDYFTSRNPWDPKRNTGGSSGGSAGSVASLQVPFSIGTETAGSIRQPSALCGVTGFKGTYGRASRYGVIAMGSSLDCPGPICRFSEDAAIIMKYISGQDSHDGTTIQEPPIDFTSLKMPDLKGLKIGISEEYLSDGIDENIVRLVQDAVKQLEKLGAKIQQVKLLDPEFAVAAYTIIQRSEVSSNLARYQGFRFGFSTDKAVKSVYDYFRDSRSIFGLEAKRRMMTGAYALAKGYYEKYYKKALQVRTAIIDDLNNMFGKVDAFVSPTSPNLAPVIGKALDNPLFGEMADRLICASTVAGLPGISIPVGFSEGLPVGMQIIAPQKQEKIIFEIANLYQQNTDWHTRTPFDD